ATTHALSAGTDRAAPLMRWGILGVTAVAAGLTVLRVVQARAAGSDQAADRPRSLVTTAR
ncbi:MAG TPA: hypothetical protein VHT97_12830, partial [Acidimicrobiales bacterium]|nr:hypothetical protein [Acidimicrobiales bacterium]